MKLNVILSMFLLICGNAYADYQNSQDKIIMAEQGSPAAQFNLGEMYYKGTGVSRNYKQAVTWYQKAAEQGYAVAQFNLGSSYYSMAFRSFYKILF